MPVLLHNSKVCILPKLIHEIFYYQYTHAKRCATEYLTVYNKLTKPTNSVAGGGEGERERDVQELPLAAVRKHARGEEGGGARPT